MGIQSPISTPIRQTDPVKLKEIRTAIRLKGWGTLSDHRNDKFGLRVSGTRDGDELLALLNSNHFTQGQPAITTNDTTEKPKGILESVKANSLRISAIGYTVGDIFYYKGSADPFDKGMALSFGFWRRHAWAFWWTR